MMPLSRPGLVTLNLSAIIVGLLLAACGSASDSANDVNAEPTAAPIAKADANVGANAPPAKLVVADADTPAADTGELPYDVACSAGTCEVDAATFIGWRTFHGFCHVCHAQDAVGSTFAPNLLERISVIDKARFIDAVGNGFTGQVGVMPPWKDNPNVSKRYDELWAYLRARADGALEPGRPKKKPKPQ